MARGQRIAATAVTEDALEHALVPEGEQPYEVPSNWTWVKGKLIFTPMKVRKPVGEFFRYIDIESIDNARQTVSEPKTIETSQAPSRASRKIECGDTIFSMVRPYLKNIAYIDEYLSDCIASTGFFVCHTNDAVNKRFIYWLMTSGYAVDGLNRYMKGDNSPSIRQENIENFSYPLPPLPEQQRIVNRIESLFTKLDEAKEKLQAVVDGFETRKATILHKAFTGELTAKWRKEHGVGMESWNSKRFEDCIIKMQNGISKRTGSSGKPYVVLRLINLDDEDFNTDDLREILLTEQEQEAYSLYKNDVIMVRVNGSKDNVGKQILINENMNWAFCDHLFRVRYDSNLLNSHFMIYYAKSEQYQHYIKDNMVSSAGQNTISRKGLAQLEIPIPSIDEQTEIVRILVKFFDSEQRARESTEASLMSIDLIKKSILARAFHSELGTNDPGEESAMALLQQVLTSPNT